MISATCSINKTYFFIKILYFSVNEEAKNYFQVVSEDISAKVRVLSKTLGDL